MPVTMASLVSDRTLALRPAAATAPLDRPVSWVHVSELLDPTPFLDGGELLLTTGLWLGDKTVVDAYVRRLVAAGIAALGFGTGLGHAELPAALVTAAEHHGLALVEVPRDTPFIAISRGVAAALAAEEYAEVARSATAQRELARAALAPGAPGAVLRRLTRAIGGWAVLADISGEVVEAVPASAADQLGELGADLDRLRHTRGPASTAVNWPGGSVLIQSLGVGQRTRGFLIVGSDNEVQPAQRYMVNTAAVVLTLLLEQSEPRDAATAQLRSAVLELLTDGRTDLAAAVLDQLEQRLPAEPVRVVIVHGDALERAAVGDLAAEVAGRAGAALLVADTEGNLALVASAEVLSRAELLGLTDRTAGVTIGCSEAVPWARFAEGLRHAREAAELAGRRGDRVLAFADLAEDGLAAIVDPDAGRAFAEALLAPFREGEAAGRGDLVRSLRTWLAHHGQYEPAAAELGVHRHTLRKRVRRAEELLGRDFDSPSVRADLWYALATTGA